MERKAYKVGFFVGKVGADGKAGTVSKLLGDLAESKCPVISRGDLYEIRDLRSFKNGASFAGAFARLRTKDIPHIGEPGGPEREIDLAEKEGLLEKNHFLYFRQHELLVYQANQSGGGVTRFAEYISDIVNETTVFAPVLQPDAVKRLMSGTAALTKLELSFARPTATDFYPKENWSKELMHLMRSADAARAHIEISSKGFGRTPRKQHLGNRMKQAVRELVNNIDVRVAKVSVDEGGVEHAIDLIADRIKGRVEVEMNGRYPVPEKMFAALREVADDNAGLLREIFGDGYKALD